MRKTSSIALVILLWSALLSSIALKVLAAKPDFYQTLRVNREASQAEIRKAYRMAALRWHPDKHKHNDAASSWHPHRKSMWNRFIKRKFIQVAQAYEVQLRNCLHQSTLCLSMSLLLPLFIFISLFYLVFVSVFVSVFCL